MQKVNALAESKSLTGSKCYVEDKSRKVSNSAESKT